MKAATERDGELTCPAGKSAVSLIFLSWLGRPGNRLSLAIVRRHQPRTAS